MVFQSVLLAVLAIALGAFLFIKKRFHYWSDRGIPSDSPIHILGNLKGVGKTHHFADSMDELYFRFKNKSPVCGVFFSLSPAILTLDLDVVKAVMVKDFNNFEDRGVYYNEKDDPLSAHLFSIEGQQWRALRQTMSPTFTSGKMKYMFPTIIEVGHRFQNKLIEVARANPEIEIKDWVARFTTDVIGTSAFGIECDCLNDPKAIFREMGRNVFEKPNQKIAVMVFAATFKSLARFLGIQMFSTEMNKFFGKVVKDTVTYRETNNVRKKDFMDIMIQLKNEGNASKGLGALTDNQILAQAFVFFIAGFETSSTLMTFCIYELCMNPEIQEKTRKHILEVLKKHNNEFTYEAVQEMKYLEQVLNETLRKYPALPTLQRMCKSDYQVPNTNIIIPKDVAVFIPVRAIQNDNDIYPDPQKFDPDRFSDEEMAKRHSFSHLPFGEGPRNCIGMRFGMIQSKIGIALILQKFSVELSSKMKLPLKYDLESFIPAIIGGMNVVMKEIKN